MTIPKPEEVQEAMDAAKDADRPVFNIDQPVGTAFTTMNRVAQADKILKALWERVNDIDSGSVQALDAIYFYQLRDAMASADVLYKEKP